MHTRKGERERKGESLIIIHMNACPCMHACMDVSVFVRTCASARLKILMYAFEEEHSRLRTHRIIHTARGVFT